MHKLLIMASAFVVSPVIAQTVDMHTQMPGVPVQIVDPTPIQKRTESTTPATAPTAALKTSKVEAKEIKPLNLSLKAGDSKMIYIASGMLNQIVTPFTNPVAKTVNQMEIFKEGSSVFLAVGSPKPISVVISDRSDPEASFTLTMIPANIPPRQIVVNLSGYTAKPAGARMDDDKEVLSQPYITRITDTLRTVASGEIPSGYALTRKRPAFSCASSLKTQTAQVLEGTRYTVLVLAALNSTAKTIVFNESDCYREDVVAVSAWPNIQLLPGEQTEIYVVLVNSNGSERLRLRPSTLQMEDTNG